MADITSKPITSPEITSKPISSTMTPTHTTTMTPAMSLYYIFHQEITNLSSIYNPKTFDAGYITEVLGKGKYKVKLTSDSSVVTASSTEMTLYGFVKKAAYVKGGLALLQVSGGPSVYAGMVTGNSAYTYLIVGIRQTGQFAPAATVPV